VSQPSYSDQAGGAAINVIATYLSPLLGKFGLGTNYKGAMAQRGLAQAAMKLSAIQFNRQLEQEHSQAAYADFARTNPFEQGFAIDTQVAPFPEKLTKLLGKNVQKLAQLQGKNQTRKVIAKERKIAAQITQRGAKLAPYTDVRISELRGANAGYWRERGAPPPLWLTQGVRT